MREKVEEYEEVIINLIHTHATELNELQERYVATQKEMSTIASSHLFTTNYPSLSSS